MVNFRGLPWLSIPLKQEFNAEEAIHIQYDTRLLAELEGLDLQAEPGPLLNRLAELLVPVGPVPAGEALRYPDACEHMRDAETPPYFSIVSIMDEHVQVPTIPYNSYSSPIVTVRKHRGTNRKHITLRCTNPKAHPWTPLPWLRGHLRPRRSVA